MRVVMTGGPGTGKSAILDGLQSKYVVLPDFSREIIELNEVHPLANHLLFQEKWLDRMLSAFHFHPTYTLFCYGIPDILVYDQWRGTVNNCGHEKAVRASVQCRYDMVLYADPIPKSFYTQDSARTMNYEEAIEIGKLTLKVYHDCGYTPIVIPYHSIEQRVETVSNLLSQTTR